MLQRAMFGAALCALASIAEASQTTTVFVDGRSGPWDITINPTFSYGVTVNGAFDATTAPAAVGTANGLAMAAGDVLTLTYLSGKANSGGGGLYYDANGIPGWDASGVNNPAYYLPAAQQPTMLGTLLGTFADTAGKIVGTPFKVGNGPIDFVIPQGAAQLLLGFNDGWHNDNGAGLTMQVIETAPVPVPAAFVLFASVLGGFGVARRRAR